MTEFLGALALAAGVALIMTAAIWLGTIASERFGQWLARKVATALMVVQSHAYERGMKALREGRRDGHWWWLCAQVDPGRFRWTAHALDWWSYAEVDALETAYGDVPPFPTHACPLSPWEYAHECGHSESEHDNAAVCR